MGKYLLLWEVDPATMPLNAKERGIALLTLAEGVKADMKKGFTKDWGTFFGGMNGYAIAEGTEVTVMTEMMMFAPYVNFEVRAVATLAQVEEAIKAAMK